MGEEFIEMVDCPDGTEADDGRLAVPDSDQETGLAAEKEGQLGVFTVEQGIHIAQNRNPAFFCLGVLNDLFQMLDTLIYVQDYFLPENKNSSVTYII